MLRLVSVLLLASLALAGCAQPTDLDAAARFATPQLALPHLELDEAHDHKDRAQHAIAWNVELLGWDPISPDPTKPGRYNQVVVSGDHAYVSTHHLAKDAPPGLAVFDITGPDPVLVGTLETPDMTTIDVFASPSGEYVFLAGHRDARVTPPAAAQACTGTPLTEVCTPFVPAGIIMVDVRDPAAPKVVTTHTSAPSGAHTVKAHDIAGATYVFGASYGLASAGRYASGVEILRVATTPVGTKLQPVTTFFASRASGPDGVARTFVHDMWIEQHPVTKSTLLYVAYWDGGVVIADVSDPARPRELAAWRDFDAAQYGNIHFVRPIGMIGERHVTMAAPEFGSAEHAGEMYVLDTTDPTKPQLLSKWTLPGNPVNDEGYRFSPHNFDPLGTQVVYAHYHGGVWVLDLADPENPAVKAYVFPTLPEEAAYEPTEDAPNVWAAVWAPDGTIYVSDIGTGLYHYRIPADDPGAAPYERFLR